MGIPLDPAPIRPRCVSWRRSFAAIAALLLLCGAAVARPFVIGSISSSPGAEIETLQPLADYLARGLRDLGTERGRVVVAPGIPEMVERVRSGAIDLFPDSPYPSLAVQRGARTKIILRAWKGGKAEYHSVIVVRNDSPIRTLRDLVGGRIAFESSFSTSGYWVPAGALRAWGLKLRALDSAGAATGRGEVGYLFSQGHDNSLLWVMRAKVDAAALGIHEWEKSGAAGTAGLRILHETPPVPRFLVSVRGDLPETMVAKVREILVSMEHAEEGRRVLQAVWKTTRFDPLPKGTEAALARLFPPHALDAAGGGR